VVERLAPLHQRHGDDLGDRQRLPV
jgi:hypothetical protein